MTTDMLIEPALYHVQFTLLGSFTILVDGTPIALPKTKDAQRLLAFLLLHPQQTHLRSFLIGLFWPDSPEPTARRLLTRALGHLRHHPSVDGLIQADVNTILLTLSDEVWVDYHDFLAFVTAYRQSETGLSSTGLSSTGLSSISQCADLTQAVALYQGDLLPGFYDDWLLPKQRQAELHYHDALMHLIALNKQRGQYQAALDHALRLSQADPLNEVNQREVMRLYMALAQPQAAQEHYRAYCDYLHSEMGVDAEEETQILFQKLCQSTAACGTNLSNGTITDSTYFPQSTHPLPPLVTENLATLPLIGRDRERHQLHPHLNILFDDESSMDNPRHQDKGRLILVEGEAGVGKTRLVEAVTHDFGWRGAYVVWHDATINAPNMPYAPYTALLDAGLTELQTRQLANLVDAQWLCDIAPLLPHVEQWLPDVERIPRTASLLVAQQRFVAAYAQILRRWSEITPLIIVFDNIDLWTADCLSVLCELMRDVQGARLVIVGIYCMNRARHNEAVWQHIRQLADVPAFMQMTVARLTSQTTTQLSHTALGSAVPMPAFESYLYQETAGNPFFVLELMLALYQEELLVYRKDNAWETSLESSSEERLLEESPLPLPRSVKSLVLQRLSLYGVEERNILNCAAIWGISFELSHVVALATLPETRVLAVLASAEQTGLIHAGDANYRFQQRLFRHILYDIMDPQERVVYHQRAYHILCDVNEYHGELALKLLHHAMHGELWAKAVNHAIASAQASKDIYAYQTAYAYLTKAAELLHAHRPFSCEQQTQLMQDILTEQESLSVMLSPESPTSTALRQSMPQNTTQHKNSSAQDDTEDIQTTTVLLAKESAPSFGRPLRPDELVAVVWTLCHPDDEIIGLIQGKRRLRHYRLIRLVTEAQTQKAVPTVAQLAAALDVSNKTIHRDLQQLRKEDIVLITRGTQ
ncbi:MAG: AAA family ATPase [Chloroflexota bacterium]